MSGGGGYFCLSSRHRFSFLVKCLYEVMFLTSIGILFQSAVYFAVRWGVVCFGTRVVFCLVCFRIFGRWLSREYLVEYSWMW